ncbi:MAG: xanthine dehydrogenase [Acidobacteria bacterium]|nr:MAG: xanthine dehydrogenase [Acidobacteriota bacterium]
MPGDLYQEIVDLRRSGRRGALATIVARRGSTPRRDAAKMLVFEDGSQLGSIGGGCVEAEVCREAAAVMRLERPNLLSFDLTETDAEESGLLCGGIMEVYVEPILPDPGLVIFGAGHVGRSIAAVASGIGFKVAVADDRVKYCNREHLPQAETLYVGPWEELFGRIPVNDSTYLLIATRGHNYDLACLRFALSSPARYIGLLGSRRKTRLLYETLEAEGTDPVQFKRVFAPVGLEIGAETPEEIAISVAAELVAVRKNLDVRPLKEALRRLRAAPGIGSGEPQLQR